MKQEQRSDARHAARERLRQRRAAPAAPSLEGCAIAEQFLAEARAGHAPRLAEYLQRYPSHKEELLAAATALPLEGQNSAASTDGIEASTSLTAGTQRALNQIFGAPPVNRLPPRVAEAPGRYGASSAEAPSVAPDERQPPEA